MIVIYLLLVLIFVILIYIPNTIIYSFIFIIIYDQIYFIEYIRTSFSFFKITILFYKFVLGYAYKHGLHVNLSLTYFYHNIEFVFIR